MRKFIFRALVGLGYKVLAAGGPGEAVGLSQAHEGKIDLLLTDVVMPKMQGPDLAGRLLVERPGMKVVFMSGYTDATVAHKDLATAGVPFLQKPIGPEVLARKVREVLDGGQGASERPIDGRDAGRYNC
ncbi:MAG: response regulator [Elusimicrobia bacterium]|nr:response regulator [Elusimicrobiota bacterium]